MEPPYLVEQCYSIIVLYASKFILTYLAIAITVARSEQLPFSFGLGVASFCFSKRSFQ